MLYKNNAVEKLFDCTNGVWVGDAKSFMFSLKGATISWSTKKQSTIALSHTEAEYQGAVVATYEAIWLKRLL